MKAFICGVSLLALTTISLPAAAESPAEAEAEAQAYLQTWEERGREACEDNERGCAAAGHALDRAAAAYERAGILSKAIAIRRMILDPKWHLDYTDYGRTATFALARNYQSIVEYEQAATLIESAVRRFPKSDEAPAALMEAFTLRLGLGQFDRAVEDFQLFQKMYSDKRPQDVCAFVLALGTTYSKEEQPEEALNLLQKQMSFIDRHGTLGQRLRTHALLGLIYAQKGDAKKATAHYDIVREGWKDPEQSVRTFYEGTDGTREEKDRRLGSALMAVGEARFFFAEQKRLELDAIRFPEFKGSADRDAVLKFVGTQVAEWLKKKRVAVEETENAYRSILDIQPVPPPRWVIASASRVGSIWSTFAHEFYRTPTPKEWNSATPLPGTTIAGTEIKRIFREQLSSAMEPYLQRAKSAFEVCANYSVKFQYTDEHSQSCLTWLGKHHRKQWVPVEEFLPAPTNTAWRIPASFVLPKP